MSSIEKEKPATEAESISLTVTSTSSPKKKKKKPELISSLPHELMLSCIARVSRLYHPTLSIVSKRFPSLLASRELYNSRSLLNCTESCLYLLLATGDDNTRWFTLCRKPDGKHILMPIATCQSPEVEKSVFVAAGSEIYSIGGTPIDDYRSSTSSRVSVLDCTSHTWREAPRMRFERDIHSACVVDGDICVLGDGEDEDLQGMKPIEVFDTRTQVWGLVNGPPWEINMLHFQYKSIGFDGKLHLLSYGGDMTYDLKKGKWDSAKRKMDREWVWSNLPYCLIENVLYCYDYEEKQEQEQEEEEEEEEEGEEEDEAKIWFNNRYGSYDYYSRKCNDYDDEEEEEEEEEEEDKNMFVWYDSEVKCWKSVKGLVRFPDFPRYEDYSRVKLVAYGGKMAVVWEDDSRFSKKTKIWCAVIVLERLTGDENGDEIWGKVEWYGNVLTDSYDLLEALAVTL